MAKIVLSLLAVIIHCEFCEPHKTMLAAVVVGASVIVKLVPGVLFAMKLASPL